MTLIRTMETPAGDKGYLQVQVVNIENNFPIQGARVSISYKGDPGRPLEEVMTNSSGQTENVSLNAPPKSYSLAPGLEQPYSEYNLMVTASGFEPLEISGTEILSGTTALQPVRLQPEGEGLQREQPVVIPCLLYTSPAPSSRTFPASRCPASIPAGRFSGSGSGSLTV